MRVCVPSECEGHELVCTTHNCEECPSDPEQTCTGECNNGKIVYSYHQPGVHPDCQDSSESCVAENCTSKFTFVSNLFSTFQIIHMKLSISLQVMFKSY